MKIKNNQIKTMKIYTLKNQITGEEKNFLKKNSVANAIRVNTDKVELAVMQNQPINKRTGEKYTIEYRDVNVNFNIEDC